jgi:hypothetical protein
VVIARLHARARVSAASLTKLVARGWHTGIYQGIYDRNSDFFRDLILMEVSELNGIVQFIVRSVREQF